MSHSQFHSIKRLYLDMHGLIFETSVWLLAESTRLLSWRVFPIETVHFYVHHLHWKYTCRLITLNFTHSITRIYCNTNAAQNQIQMLFTCTPSGNHFVQQSTTQLSKASFYILRVKQARTKDWHKRIISPINYKQFAHVHPICTVHKMNPRYN